MKTYFVRLTMIAAFVACLNAALFVGCASKPPTKVERQFFDVQTNYTPVVSVRTNVVEFTTYRTNDQQVVVPVTVFQTNVVAATNYAESYLYRPGAGAQEVAGVAGAVGNLFGVGGLTSTGVTLLFGLWAYIRSRKNLVTAANIAQTVETVREFIKGLPNGATIDNELVNWMQTHQAEEGVLNQVLDLLTSHVSNPDARVAADQIRATIEALKKTG